MNDQPIHRSFALLMVTAMLFVLGCALADTVTSSATPLASPVPTGAPTVALSKSESTFDYNSLVGQPASSFTLMDATGQPYTFTPNDSRKHVVVFYMGYG